MRKAASSKVPTAELVKRASQSKERMDKEKHKALQISGAVGSSVVGSSSVVSSIVPSSTVASSAFG